MGLTARQVRIFTDAAIDSMPSYDEDEEDSEGNLPSQSIEKIDNKIAEPDRRRHRQLLRNSKIKPNAGLAERQRVGVSVPKKSIMKKSTPSEKNSANSIGQLMEGASKTSGFKVTTKAKRLLELGGYR